MTKESTYSYIEAKGIRRITGLMFRTRNTSPLLFEFKKEVDYPIHSFFVFFPFVIGWFDKDKNLIEERIIKPFRGSARPNRKYKYFMEIPL